MYLEPLTLHSCSIRTFTIAQPRIFVAEHIYVIFYIRVRGLTVPRYCRVVRFYRHHKCSTNESRL